MDLGQYFQENEGVGVLSTADKRGRVNSAVYARPRVIDKNTVAFVMMDKLSHDNILENPSAAYLFVAKNGQYEGKRLSLAKVREEEVAGEQPSPYKEKCPCASSGKPDGKRRFLVTFKIEGERPLIGSEA